MMLSQSSFFLCSFFFSSFNWKFESLGNKSYTWLYCKNELQNEETNRVSQKRELKSQITSTYHTKSIVISTSSDSTVIWSLFRFVNNCSNFSETTEFVKNSFWFWKTQLEHFSNLSGEMNQGRKLKKKKNIKCSSSEMRGGANLAISHGLV